MLKNLQFWKNWYLHPKELKAGLYWSRVTCILHFNLVYNLYYSISGVKFVAFFQTCANYQLIRASLLIWRTFYIMHFVSWTENITYINVVLPVFVDVCSRKVGENTAARAKK